MNTILLIMLATLTLNFSCKSRDDAGATASADAVTIGLHGRLIDLKDDALYLRTPLKNQYKLKSSSPEIMKKLHDNADENGNYVQLIGVLDGDTYDVSEVKSTISDRVLREDEAKPKDPGAPTTGQVYDFFYEPQELSYTVSIDHIFAADERFVIPVPKEKAANLAIAVNEYVKKLGAKVVVDREPECSGQPCRVELLSDLNTFYFEEFIKNNPFPGGNEIRITNPWPYQSKIAGR